MPGLRRQPGISLYTNSIYHADMHTPPVAPKYSWDRENSVVSRRPIATSRPPKWLLQQTGRDYLGAKAVSAAPAVSACYGSDESDDLQAMVHDFIENDPFDYMDGVDSDGSSPGKKLIETLQMRTAALNALERELLTEVKLRLLAINEDADLVCDPSGSDCKGACVKRFVVKHLKVAGYDAAVYMSKWLRSGRVPGGEYEYIDVVFNDDDDDDESQRLIVDVDFQSQFEIARPTPQYEAALNILPAVFVGSASKLHHILEYMSEAAKVSLKQNHMHLPPWRTLEYMSSKWLSIFERKTSTHCELQTLNTVAKQCSQQLRHTKAALLSEITSSSSSSAGAPRSSRAKPPGM